MQEGWSRHLFYLNTLYEFAHDISRQKHVEEILKRFLRIVIGAFGVAKGVVLSRSGADSTFELITHEHLDPPTIESISHHLRAEIFDDLENVDGLVEVSSSPKASSTPTTVRNVMASAGVRTLIILRVQERLKAYVGLGPLLSETPFSSEHIELLSVLTKQTEIALGNALFLTDILQENQQLKEALHRQYQFENMVGWSSVMQEIYQRVQQIARYPNYSVLITGESGTGKELIARAIHHLSPRKDRMFLPINCAALPVELVESELFGHEKGAFTGATVTKPGAFEVSEGGTLFLDEIAEMPPQTQAKLLRVLQEKEVMRIGGRAPRTVDVRVIAATNRDLKKAIPSGQFREDLFYRLDIPIHTPPLRERKEDIPLLVKAFLEGIAQENHQPMKVMSPEGLKVLMNYDWPGNVRELRKVLIQAVMVTEGSMIRPPNIPLSEDEISIATQDEIPTATQVGVSLKDAANRFKQIKIEEALRQCDGNLTKGAAQLGISRQNLQNMMRRLRMSQ